MNKDEAVRLFKALGDPTRFAIVGILSIEPHSVSDLVAKLEKSQPAVSIALQKLATAGVVTTNREGNSIIYTVNPAVKQLLKSIGAK